MSIEEQLLKAAETSVTATSRRFYRAILKGYSRDASTSIADAVLSDMQYFGVTQEKPADIFALTETEMEDFLEVIAEGFEQTGTFSLRPTAP